MPVINDNTIRKPTSPQMRNYLEIVLRHKLLIIISFLSVFLSTAFYVYQKDEVYEAFSTFVIEEETSIIRQAYNIQQRSLSFYQGILKSRTFIDMVLDSIGTEMFKKVYPEMDKNEIRNFLFSTLTLRSTDFKSFYRLNARARAPQLAYFIANISADLFTKRCREVESEESRRAVIEIEKQVKIVREKLEKAEHDFNSFKESSGDIVAGTPPELSKLQEVYANDLAQLGLKEANLKAEKNQLQKLENEITPDEKKDSPEIQKLREELEKLEKERLRLEKIGINLSSASTISRKIDEVERQIISYQRKKQSSAVTPNTIRQWQQLRKSVVKKEAELELFRRKLASYKKAINNFKKKNPDMLSRSLELIRMKRQKEIYENLYNILLEKAEEERIRSASRSAGLKIVDIARLPEKPLSKNEKRYYVLGVLVGLALGIGLAFLIEFNDTSIKSTEDIENYLRIPVLGTIPHIMSNKKDSSIKIKRQSSKARKKTSTREYPRHLLNFSSDDSISAESYRSLRTNLSFASPDKPVQCMVMSSAGPSEGKSLTTANLALAYSQMGKKTLLIDTDLRRPIQHHLFNKKREPGFSNLFSGSFEFDKIVNRIGDTDLYLLTAGIFTPNPAELLASKKMNQYIEFFRENFDIIFFDSPPLIAVTDASLLSTKTDGILLVVRSHKTRHEVASQSISNLRNIGVKIIGSVLNDINLTHRYSSYGYYKYYYHYYRRKMT